MREIPFERIVAITRDILSVRGLEPALESIALAVRDLYGFRYVTIVAADESGGDMVRRVMLGWNDDVVAARKYERIVRADIIGILNPACEVVKNGYFTPAELEFEWDKSIYAGSAPHGSPREAPDHWHERDTLIFILPDNRGEMLAYISADEPLDGKIPTLEMLRSMQLFVNLVGLAVAHAYAHAAEINRRELLEASQSRLRHEATHDALTGLPNRTLFVERLGSTLERARAGGTHAVLFIDLDEFKSLNDSLGHAAGDAMLRTMAERMAATIAPADFVARLGGDEFAILVAACESRADIERVATDIHAALVRPLEIDGRIVYSTASIGIATIGTHDETIEGVLRKADTAMYHAKASGRARHAFYDDEMHRKATRRLTLASALRAALERGELSVVYQPIVDLAGGRIVAFEALARWIHPTVGEVSPVEFVPLAEDIGLIVDIGRFVFIEACEKLATWRALAPDRRFRMHVNLSVHDVLQPNIDAFVLEHLRRLDLPPDAITLELTETAIMRSGSVAFAAFERLRATGVRLAIDDFGTGYSSLSYLHQFPINSLKIDRSFVGGRDGELASPPIVRMMIQLAEIYGIDVVAEGVETAAQVVALGELGCAYAQGFYFYRPMRPDAVAALVAKPLRISA